MAGQGKRREVRGEAAMVPVSDLVHRERRGVGGTSIIAGRILSEEFNPKLENEKGWGSWGSPGIFEKMRRSDPQIARSLKLLKLPILAADWEVDPPTNPTPLETEIADFVSHNLFQRLRWRRTLRQALTYKDFGFSLFEVLETHGSVPAEQFPGIPTAVVDNAGPVAQVPAVLWKSWEARMARTVDEWIPDPANPTQLDAVRQFAGFSDVEDAGFYMIPATHLVRFTNEQEAANFAGISALRPAYKAWKIKELLERVDAIRHERQNVGIPKITLPEDAADGDYEKAEEILAALASHEKGFIVLPAGWEFSWDTSGSGGGTDINARIGMLDRDIADNVLAGFMTLGNGDTGSYALAETQADIYLLQLEEDARYIEESINEGQDGTSQIRRLVNLNYGPQARYPVLKGKNLRSRDYVQILSLIAQMLQTEAITADTALENLIRDKLHLPPVEEDPEGALIDEPETMEPATAAEEAME